MKEEKVHIIAEAGTNHNGSFDTAKTLIDVAKEAEADSVKFQIIYPDRLYLPGEYEFGHYDINEVRAMRRRFMLTDNEYRKLSVYANQQGIKFSSSVFDQRGADLIAELKPEYIKIASTDLNNVKLLRIVSEKGIKMIVSTGMSSLSQVEKSVNEIYKTGNTDVVLMHCVSAYPSKLENMNLGFIDTLKTAFGFPVALSDHTQGSLAACIALSKGISYIEKHYTLDCNQEGFDHKYAAEPNVFKQYVKDIRMSEAALRRPEVKLAEDELYVKKRARRSLYAARDIKSGEVLSDDDILVVRPSAIVDASDYDFFVGQKTTMPIKQYEPFSFNIIER
ncbi:MAG: N-acetylneuraminate synthase family protein [Bacteroidota bacterium]